MQLPDAIDAIRPSVVQIRVRDPGSDRISRLLGTGFLVTPTVVVTAAHVVAAVDFAAGATIYVGFAGPVAIDAPGIKIRAPFEFREGRVLAVETPHDLALIEVRKPMIEATYGPDDVPHTPARPVRLSSGKVRDGTPIAVSGYPLDEPALVTNAGILASSFSLDQTSGGFEERHLGDFTANPGNSGGPVYKVADAAVVGVCVAGRLTPIVAGEGLYAAGLTLIVPVVEVAAFLETHGRSLGERATSTSGKANRRTKKRRRR